MTKFHRNRAQPTGYSNWCKECRNARQRHYKYTIKYGVSEEFIDALIEAQGGRCAVCHDRKAVQVDHDHTTGRVRGVLCLRCNTMLGKFRDDPAIIRRAIDYLKVRR